METFEQRRCAICGAIIGDDNPDGIGGSCREVYRRARYWVFMESQERRNAYYKIMNDFIMARFTEQFKDTKFRSAFRKQFYPSIVSQYKEKGYISKKQMEIVRGWLEYVPTYGNREWCESEAYVRKLQAATIKNWDYTSEEREAIVERANNLRGSI